MNINNESISIGVNTKGAELRSLKSLKKGKEYLWQADSNVWGRHAPILFPIVGTLKDNEYIYDGEIYSMSRHGFARDNEFDLVEKNEKYIKLVLKENKETLKMYPFKFELYVSYELIDNKVIVNYEVNNTGDRDMYFSIGGHPAFNCDLESGKAYLEFCQGEELESKVIDIKNGLISDKTEKIESKDAKMMLNNELFSNDALIFEGMKKQVISIKNQDNDDSVKVSFDGFKYVGVWSKPAQFVCIEPWFGIADYHDANKKIEDKVGIMKLKEGEMFTCNYSIEVL